MLLTLISGFALSQAYRTLAGILSVPLTEHFQLSPQTMGLIAATFHYAFGGMQLLMGIGIDVFAVAQRYMGTEKSSTSSMFFIGVSAYCSKKVVGTKTVINPAITNPITNHLPMS